MRSNSSEDVRQFLQERLALFYGVGLAIAATFLVAVVGIRSLLGDPIAELKDPSRYAHVAATTTTAVLYLLTRRGKRSEPLLRALDVAGILVITALLNVNAGLFSIRTVSVFNLALTTGVAAVLRAVIVPSAPGRTLALGLVASAGAVAIFFLSALWEAWPVKQRGRSASPPARSAGWSLPRPCPAARA